MERRQAAAVVILTVVSCRQPTSAPAGGEAARRPANEAEAGAFGVQFAQAVVHATERLNGLFDGDALIDRVGRKLGLAEQARRDFRRGARKNPEMATTGAKIFGDVSKNIGPNGSYKPLRSFTVVGERRLRMRLVDSDGSVEYQDLVLETGPQGTVSVDMETLSTGELASATLGRL